MNPETKKPAPDQRGEVMRARLLSATLDVILEKGWAGASTPKICEQAKVSRGAQTHHFPTRTALFMAALDKVAREYEASIGRRMEGLEVEQRTLRAVLEVIWEACLDDRFLQTSMEALVAGRTDPELRGYIGDLDDDAITSMRSVADNMAEQSAPLDLVKDAIELSIYLFRGIAVQRGIHDDERYKQDLFEVWCRLIENALENESPTK